MSENKLNLDVSGAQRDCPFIVDKTPTPNRLLQNLEGLFEEENVFDATFRKANENPAPPVRRMISIQNEDTLHTPQIPLHLYKPESEVPVSPKADDPKATKETRKKINRSRNTDSPSRRRKRGTNLDHITPQKLIAVESGDSPIPVSFRDAIQIKPKWAVVLKYPSFDSQCSAKDRLRALLVKNDSSKSHTITLTPPSPVGVTTEVQLPAGKVALPPVTQTTAPVKHMIKEHSALERNNAATKRYRNKKKQFYEDMAVKNRKLEEENLRLKEENRRLNEKLAELQGQHQEAAS